MCFDKDKSKKDDLRSSCKDCKAKQLGIEGRLIVKQWHDLKKKYSGMCLCCKRYEPEISLTIDHIVPFSKRGLNTIDSIQSLCGYCNKCKYNKIADYMKEVCYA